MSRFEDSYSNLIMDMKFRDGLYEISEPKTSISKELTTRTQGKELTSRQYEAPRTTNVKSGIGFKTPPKFSLPSATGSLATPLTAFTFIVDAMVNKGLDMYAERGYYATPELQAKADASKQSQESLFAKSQTLSSAIPRPTEKIPSEEIEENPKAKNLLSVLSNNGSIISRDISEQTKVMMEQLSAVNKQTDVIAQGQITTLEQTSYQLQLQALSVSNQYEQIAVLNSIQDSIKAISDNQVLNTDISTAYNEASLEVMNKISSDIASIPNTLTETSNIEAISSVGSSINSLSSSLKNNGIAIQRSEAEKSLTDKKLEHITYETTPVQLENLGDTIPKATPQEMRALKDVAVAKKNSDENTFEIDEDDIADMFTLPDISEVFSFNGKTKREVVKD